MRHGLQLFSDIVEGLTYLHAQNIAHLDFDIYNIAIDRELRARVIDFGSSQLMDHRGFVAAGDVDIKAKFLFVAPEVRKHSRLRVPRPGFDGARADLWSAGVVVS
jgi:5'-AMP-activated protein kinase catalytic alpha subunit